MSVNHDQIVNSVKQVVQFFSEARCVSGSKTNSKSKSLVHKPDSFKDSPSDDILHFWEEVKKYDSERDQTTCLVIGWYGIVAAQCISGVRSAVVLITSEDMNNKSFDKQIGKLLLAPKATLCAETFGLSHDGIVRLNKFIQSATALFDGRLCIAVFDIEGLVDESLIEKRFDYESIDVHTKKRKSIASHDQSFSSAADCSLRKCQDLEIQVLSKTNELNKLHDWLRSAESRLENIASENSLAA